MNVDVHKINFSFGANKYDNRPINHSLSWDDFGIFISSHKSPCKGINYVTSAFGNDGRRCKSNAEPRSWLAFDMDGNLSNQECLELLKFFKNLKCYFYETASSSDNSRRVRIIIACDREINELESKLIGDYLTTLSPIKNGWDKSTFLSSQPIYLPPISKDLMSYEGESLPIDRLLAAIPPPATKRQSIRKSYGKQPNAYEFFHRNQLILSESNLGSFDVICPWANEHTNADISGSVYFPPSPLNKEFGGFKCQHSHCETRTIKDIFKLLEIK